MNLSYLPNMLSRLLWKKRFSQGIGLVYGLFGLPFVILTIVWPFGLPHIFQSAYDLSGYMLLLLIYTAITLVLFALGIGFWFEKNWAYNMALLLHGLPLLGEVVSWTLFFLGLMPRSAIPSPALPESIHLGNLFVVSFVLLAKIFNYVRDRREMPYGNKF